EQGNLRGALGLNHQRWSTAGATLLRSLEFFGELFDATLDIPLEVVSSLVLRNDAKHLPQTLKALARVARLAECSLRGFVLGRQVARHDSVGGAASALRRSVPAGPVSFVLRHRRRCPRMRNGSVLS